MLNWRKIKIQHILPLLAGIILCIIIVSYAFYIKKNLFQDTFSTVILDHSDDLLGAKIADDGQWRFPPGNKIPEKYRKALLFFEDKHFYYHPGFNPVSLVRAAIQNIKAGKIVSGGSTISMQVIRMAGKGRPRTVVEKIREICQALLLELVSTKEEILLLYASNAPYGGNVVGLEAASWRYFNRNPHNLTWAEASLLAVLPNSPSLIHPGRNRDELRIKRNSVLEGLKNEGIFDNISFQLSLLEPIPEKPKRLPLSARHLISRVDQKYHGQQINTTIDKEFQGIVNAIVDQHANYLEENKIHNIAVLVAEVESGNVKAYIGNTRIGNNPQHNNFVDVIPSPRSTGSIMKPFLYAVMLDDGMILPNTLVMDIPTFISGFSPKNYDLEYDGAVPASQALSRSLNIPAVRMLRDYGYERFHYNLKKLGISTLSNIADHYGLSLILGGAEASLWDLTGIFASMSRTLNHFYELSGNYDKNDFRPLNIYTSKSYPSVYEPDGVSIIDNYKLSAGSIWLTYKALKEVNRPIEEINWEDFSSSQEIAWKTGTSFGFKDAWAIGTTHDYVVGVWVGNADGEGRPGLIGTAVAAPIMFDVFRTLPSSQWFDKPFDELRKVPVCVLSGYRAGELCEEIDSTWILKNGLLTQKCPYHKLIHLDSSENYRVSNHCEPAYVMKHKSWFVLPPVVELYYMRKNPMYKPLPPIRQDCYSEDTELIMEFIYPVDYTKIFIPIEFGSIPGKVVFEVAHRIPEVKLYWHLDDQYLGATTHIHQLECRPDEGMHLLRVIDETGNAEEIRFEVVSKSIDEKLLTSR